MVTNALKDCKCLDANDKPIILGAFALAIEQETIRIKEIKDSIERNRDILTRTEPGTDIYAYIKDSQTTSRNAIAINQKFLNDLNSVRNKIENTPECSYK